MLKAAARVLEFRESSISRKTLRIILCLMLLSLPVWPIMMMIHHGVLPDSWILTTARSVMILGVISMICFLCTRFVNRFYFPDKYLDEWEITIKHKSMSFAFMVMVWIISPIFVAFMVWNDVGVTLSWETVGIWGIGFLLAMLYMQTFHALWQVRPFDDDAI